MIYEISGDPNNLTHQYIATYNDPGDPTTIRSHYNVLKGTKVTEIHTTSLQDSGESGDEMQDDETTTHYLVPCNMIIDTTVQNKTPSWLLNVIMDSGRTDTTTNC